ncbi:acetylcholine receptor subunit alpha-type acr-16 [Trichonephila clavata]|uniref:Acetylcholine receptor subunit alpha-type acr-16 n=1 Tax=Trichonephila clavata TaxID=2740835 RepID=A0A8X6JDA0_TRICU|nr:acetylcholine receptor subunit alpha-type acr-16 [Trichonephila clavata]
MGLTSESVDRDHWILMVAQEWVDVNLRWNASEYGGVKDLRIPPWRIWKPDVLMYNRLVRVAVHFPNAYCSNLFETDKLVIILYYYFRKKIDLSTYTAYIAGENLTLWKLYANILEVGFTIDMEGLRLSEDNHVTKSIILKSRHIYSENSADADEKFDGTYHTNVVVRNNGSCTYIPPGIFKSTCKIDITWFPFDDQKCEMKFGSWTYDGYQLDLRLSSEDGGDLSTYISNGEWDLIALPGQRNVLVYACCPEPYVDVTFYIHIRRRTLYYGFNLIIPCVLISSMALLGFALPPDSGEKLTLGTYFACIMIMVAFSVVMTVVVLNYHHRSSDTHEMPHCIRSVFLGWLPRLLLMERPKPKLQRKGLLVNSKKEFELKERSSKSLLANVLDIDEAGFRQNDAGTSNFVPPEETPATVRGCFATQRELSAILRELRYITSRMKREDKVNDIIAEWKYAAMVVDRMCLILFTAFTVLSTCICLFSAPHLIA